MGTTLHPDVAKMFQKRQSGNSKGNGMASALTVRRRTITQTSDGLVCLDDIWIAAKSPKGKSPAKWRSGQPVRELQIALYEKLYGRTGNYEFARIIRQVKDPQRTFAHPILAVSYASFLSPQLAIEVKEVWLRYAQGDPTLADEILQKSSAEANEWVGVRALSRATRKDYTATLHQHGVREVAMAHVRMRSMKSSLTIPLFN